MASCGWRYLLYSCVFRCLHGIVPQPQNVRIHSVNFNSTLKWEPLNFHKENMTYTVQYKTYFSGFTDLCTRIAFTECSLSSISLLGNSTVRVRTESEKEQSDWKMITFMPMDTDIGPPDVHIEPRPRALYIEVRGPFVQHNGDRQPIQHFYSKVVYSMWIWKKDDGEQMKDMHIINDSEMKSGLDPRTTYCIQVRVLLPESNKTGEWSKLSCVATTDNDISSLVLTVCLLSAFIVFVLWMVFCVYQRVKYVFCRSYSLPQHFKEFLSKPFYSSQSLALQGEDHSYEKITVVSENSTKEQLNNVKQELQNAKEISEAKKVSDCPLLSIVQTEWNHAQHFGGILQSCS